MSDWIGREKAITVAAFLSIIAMIALFSVSDTSQPRLLYVHAACLGYGAGLFGATIFAGTADIFHGEHFGSIGGLLIAGFAIGGAIGPWLGSYMYDIRGSYDGAFILSMVCFGISCVIFCIAYATESNHNSYHKINVTSGMK